MKAKTISRTPSSPSSTFVSRNWPALLIAGIALGALVAIANLNRAQGPRPRPTKDTAAVASSPAGGATGKPETLAANSAGSDEFGPTVENKLAPPGDAPPGMVWIPGGEFSMGCRDPRGLPSGGPDGMPDARPIHRVYVDGFWMDETEVTNAEFAKFVEATGYRTIAEIAPRAEDYPGAPPENLVAGSVVFTPPDHPVPLNNHYQWWAYVHGASWRHPLGPDSSIEGKDNYPVVQVAYDDVVAYCQWAGKRLPTEAEWEFAARGGRPGLVYLWGNDFNPEGKWLANTFQGKFPRDDVGTDGFVGIAPTRQFPANPYGLHDMAGNVWEWCHDWYRYDYYPTLAAGGGVAKNPQGPESPLDPAEPTEKKRVHRGGSFLCTDQYCTRYMVGTRGKGEVTTASNHVGFRCVKSPVASQTEKPASQ